MTRAAQSSCVPGRRTSQRWCLHCIPWSRASAPCQPCHKQEKTSAVLSRQAARGCVMRQRKSRMLAGRTAASDLGAQWGHQRQVQPWVARAHPQQRGAGQAAAWPDRGLEALQRRINAGGSGGGRNPWDGRLPNAVGQPAGRPARAGRPRPTAGLRQGALQGVLLHCKRPNRRRVARSTVKSCCLLASTMEGRAVGKRRWLMEGRMLGTVTTRVYEMNATAAPFWEAALWEERPPGL
jgi:hypothetical protein